MEDTHRSTSSPGDLRSLVAYSLFSGLCPLIPIPILDDWARDLLRRRLVARLATASGTALAETTVKILACGYRPPGAGGCARGCLRTLVLRPVVFLAELVFRKLVRKVLFFLTVKDAVDTFSETFHEAYLVRHALRLGAVPADVDAPGGDAAAPPAPDPRLLAVRRAVETVYRGTDTRPVTSLARSLFRGSWRLLMRTAREMTRLLRRRRRGDEGQISERLASEGEARLGSLIDELTADLEQQGGYLTGLEAALAAALTPDPEPG